MMMMMMMMMDPPLRSCIRQATI